jgi:hypothetical protein
VATGTTRSDADHGSRHKMVTAIRARQVFVEVVTNISSDARTTIESGRCPSASHTAIGTRVLPTTTEVLVARSPQIQPRGPTFPMAADIS